MKVPILIIVLLFIFQSCNAPKEETAKQYSINQFMDIVQINGGSFFGLKSQKVKKDNSAFCC